MKKAKKAGGSKCVKLATKARRQGEIGYAQALRERGGSGHASVYTVSKGDSLWSISGSSSVYGDPYQWPLIYKANRSQINDADLIFPGQALDIDRGASSADISAAISHAKTRGAWAIGVAEDSDAAYLAR
ncbi:MAG: LysM peptidoglycan-binding domain-containing protein [Sulfuriflexus sp.]|nr:LysM peptidoglycan-binding domain-containing protein [Sulfuriflexus sp.]